MGQENLKTKNLGETCVIAQSFRSHRGLLENDKKIKRKKLAQCKTSHTDQQKLGDFGERANISHNEQKELQKTQERSGDEKVNGAEAACNRGYVGQMAVGFQFAAVDELARPGNYQRLFAA